MPPNSGAGSTSSSPHSLGLATSPLSTATFAPRREFVKSPHPISSFYLLSFAGNSFLRLSNFPSSLVRSLKQSLDPVRDFKDDPQQKLWEITLNGKPWASPKAVETERLILRILSRLLSHGFTFLSSIDYGRESDDKLTFVFSKATPSSGSSSLPSVVQIPFGLSFPSPTILRAINVPLASTPTILQALRTAWPRGISQEKKLTDGCYEFKLKGYSFFQEDTFPIDSLNHILNLLSSLDERGFTLMASLCLSGNHHRVKDLWILSGREDAPMSTSPSEIESPPRIPNLLQNGMATKQSENGANLPLWEQFSSQKVGHERSTTAPVVGNQGFSSLHAKSASEGHTRGVLHKQTVVPEGNANEIDFFHIQPSSGIDSSNRRDPTSSHTQLYAAPSDSLGRVIYTSPRQAAFPSAVHVPGDSSSGADDEANTPADERLAGADSAGAETAPPDHSEELLNSQVFRVTNYRDTTMSQPSPSDSVPQASLPILLRSAEDHPATLDGIVGSRLAANTDDRLTPTADVAEYPQPAMSRTTTDLSTPMVPGGWAPTPAEELQPPLDKGEEIQGEERAQEVPLRTADRIEGEHGGRKSQFGVTGVVEAEPNPNNETGGQEERVPGSEQAGGNSQVTGGSPISETGSKNGGAGGGGKETSDISSEVTGGATPPSLFKRMFSREARRQSKLQGMKG